MRNKRLLIPLLLFLSSMIIPFGQATTITACTFDKDTYNQGETGHITVTIYNDEDSKIRVTGLTAAINYYYDDGNVYVQTFYTDATLPAEIQPGNSSSFSIPFSLPTNIASGYTSVYVKAITEEWNLQSEMWFAAEHPTYQPLLYIESPYKEQLEEQVTINEQLEEQLEDQQTINEQLDGQLEEQVTINEQLEEQLEDQQTINEQLEDQLDQQQTANEQLDGQLEEQLATNKNVTNMMYLFGVTTIVFAAVTVLLFIVNRRMRVLTQPIA